MQTAVIENIEVISDYELERNKPMPSKNHGIIQVCLIIALRHIMDKYSLLSEVKIEMPEKPDLVPDLCIYPKLKVDFQHDKLVMTDMPLVAIEIMSASQSNDEILAKIERYFDAGVKSCWMVLPSLEAICVYSSLNHYTFFESSQVLIDPITQVSIDLKEVFK